jgi:1-acyl-sn-glycerol-3-phosphate acyltransferase
VVRAVAQVFRAFLVASAFFWFWAGGALLAWTLCPILILAYRDEVRRWRACQRIVKRACQGFHRYMELLALVELRVVGATPERPPGPVVIVANHPTLVDATAILSTYDDVCCIVKESLMTNVFVGRLFRTCGHVPGADAQGMSGLSAIDAARHRLDVGLAVLFFPEGTRSPPLGMRRFRRGAFEIAARSHVPIWPVLVTCQPPALSKGLPIWKHPERVARLRIEPIAIMPPLEDSRAACKNTEALFRERLPGVPISPPPDASRARPPAPTAAQ